MTHKSGGLAWFLPTTDELPNKIKRVVSSLHAARAFIVTLMDYLTQHYAPVRLNLGEDSEEQIAVAIRRLNAHVGRTVNCDELTKAMVCSWLKALTKKQAAATVNGKRASILCLWEAAHAEGHAPPPPDRKEVPRVRDQRRLPNSWTVEQMRLIVTNCRKLTGRFRRVGIAKADFVSSLVLFEYDTGTRLTANLEVRTSDINMETGLVYLRSESAKTGLEQFHYLSTETLAAIATHWDSSREFVWPWPSRNRHGLWDALRTVLKASGLPHDRRSMYHRFRRTTATILTSKVGIAAASAALGHTSEAMTRKYVDPTNLSTIRPADVLPRLNG